MVFIHLDGIRTAAFPVASTGCTCCMLQAVGLKLTDVRPKKATRAVAQRVNGGHTGLFLGERCDVNLAVRARIAHL